MKKVKADTLHSWSGTYMKEREVWEKKHPVLYYLETLYYSVTRFVTERLHPNQVKYFYQRGMRGWSDRDCFGFDYYISAVIVGCLEEFKTKSHGVPILYKNKSESQAIKEWHTILDKIINTFKTSKKIADGRLEYVSTSIKNGDDYRKKLKKIYNKKSVTKVMTKAECKKLEEGFDLFKLHFFSLWD